MYNFRWILSFFCLLFWLPGIAQDGIEGFKNFRSLTKDDGLPSNTVTCFAKDSSGFMWIGTRNGLVRYDGSNVTVYQNIKDDLSSISGNIISDIQMAGDSVMWVATNKSGLSKFHFKTRKFTNYHPISNDSTSLPSEEIYALDLDPSGQLWIGTHRAGFCKYNPETDDFTGYAIPYVGETITMRQNNIVQKIIFDNHNPDIVWIVALQSLVRFNKKTEKFTFFNPYQDQPESKAHKLFSIHDGLQTQDGKIYLTFMRYGVWTFNPKRESWENYTLKSYNPINRLENSYKKIEQKDERSFWLISNYRGIFILNLDDGFIKPLEVCDGTTSEKLCAQSVQTISMNQPEGYWIGTKAGIRLYNKRGNQFHVFAHQPYKEVLKNRSTITAIYQVDTDGVYYGGYAGEGVYYYNLSSKSKKLISPPEKYTVGPNVEMFYTRAILPFDRNHLLVLSENALFKLNIQKNQLTEVQTGLEYKKDYYYLHRIFHHSNGKYYLTTRHNGIYILNSNFKVIGQLKHDEQNPNSLISSNYIYEICEDPTQKLWIGTEDGFSIYDPKTSHFDNFSYKQRIDSIPQLKIIFKILCAPDSSVWIIDGRANAVSIPWPYKKPFQYKPVQTGENGIADRMNNVLFAKNGMTYISTSSGLSILHPDGKIDRYNEKEGLPKLHPLGPMIESADGRIFIASKNKLIYFHPKELKKAHQNTPLYLTSLSIFDIKQNINPDSLQKAGLTLTYQQNFFSLKMSSLNFDNPEEYKLSYRLKGLNDSWITDRDKKAVFTNIPGGNYTFQARLIDKNNRIQKSHFQLPIEIIPPFWKTWWFRLSLILIFLLIVTAFYLIRIRSIRREAALTTAFNKRIANMELSSLRAQMNPHFLFNSLNSIRHQILSNQKVEADRYLLKFSRLVRLILNNSRQQLIPLGDELEALSLYIELESSRFEHKFDYQLKIDESVDIEKLCVPPILIQPFVENAIWHGLMQKATPGEVIIDIKSKDNNLIIRIKDDGIGRKKAKELRSKTARKRESMGLEITGNRLEIIEKIYNMKCSAEIIDLKNPDETAAGTEVILTLPLIYEN